MQGERGQTLVEFVAIVPVIALALVGTAGFLRQTYRRTECARLVFEGVRSRLEGGAATAYRLAGVEIRGVADGVEGRMRCGLHVETLFLPRIDRRRPGASPFPSSF